MRSWRDHILKEFTPNVARLTLVADPDGLLLEEGMLEGIRDRGFELIPFDDHIAFRYAYESKFRARWDQGEHTDLVVVLHSPYNDLGRLPHDLLQAGRKLYFNLGEIFPTLSYPVLTALVRTSSSEDRSQRLAKLIDGLGDSLPAEDAKHTDWFHFARRWAEMVLLSNEQDALFCATTCQSVKHLQVRVDARFAAWLLKRYAALVNLPPSPPVMLHHVPRFLARQMDDGRAKIALIVMDGLSLDQWLIVREVLAAQRPDLIFREHSVFAWIPSITAVSRQAAFAGKAPIFLPNSIHTNEREPALWTQFWAGHGLLPNEVLNAKGLGEGSTERIFDAISRPKVKIAGLIIDKVDKIMHGMELGTAGMHNQVRQWTHLPYLSPLVDLLLTQGFHVCLTSDHGNIAAKGCGRPAEGVIAELRGQRVRVYPDQTLRSKVKQLFPAALEWEPVGLPEGYLPLIAGGRQAFVTEDDCIVSHGGISVEEIIVPFVEIERKATCPHVQSAD